MTRITLGELKVAARNRMSRRQTGRAFQAPTPMPSAQSAIRRFHREGPAEARLALVQSFERSPYWGPGGSPQARGWATAVVECFDTYDSLASADVRPVLGSSVAADVDVGPNKVGVTVDVVLLDPGGYVGRHVLWDRQELTEYDAEILSAAIAQALTDELGVDRIVGVELWHLRSGGQVFVPAQVAFARLDTVTEIVAGYVEET